MRQVCLILGTAAGLLQLLFLSAGSEDVRGGALTGTAALLRALLYAFAVGAAAFAGERDLKTLGFLDALPVGRGKLWLGKVSFALVSTFVLALLLAGMAALGTEHRDPLERYAYGELSRVFGTLLFEAVAWSLFWSSLTKNPLLAGVMGVLSVYASAMVMEKWIAPEHLLASNDLVTPKVVPARLLAAAMALAISFRVMTWKSSGRSISWKQELAVGFAPVPLWNSSTSRSLIWQAWREGWTTWLLVGLVSLGFPIISWLTDSPFGGLDSVLVGLASLVAGVSVFGLENASSSRQFLVHHGVQPGSVWWRKLLAWGVVMGSIFVLGTLSLWMFRYRLLGRELMGPGILTDLTSMFFFGFLNTFAVGLVCGMAITRRITAAMVGILVLIPILPIQIGLVSESMVPFWSPVLVLLILFAISRAWAADWLYQREGPRPWIRLAGLIVVPFGLLGVAYIAYRAFSIPDIGPQFPPTILQGETIPPEQNAAEDYRRAIRLVLEAERERPEHVIDISQHVQDVIDSGWNPDEEKVVEWWQINQSAINRTRTASAKPQAQFAVNGSLNLGSAPLEIGRLGRIMALDTRERLSRGNLAGAWDDILVQFRMAQSCLDGQAEPDADLRQRRLASSCRPPGI